MNNRNNKLEQIKRTFLSNLNRNFPENAFSNSDLLIKSFKGLESLNKNGKPIQASSNLSAEDLRDILLTIEENKTINNRNEEIGYDRGRFKQTLKDLGITDEMLNPLQLSTTDILKTEAILFNILTTPKSEIFAEYMDNEENIDLYQKELASFKDDIRSHILDGIYEAKIFPLSANKEINQLMAHIHAISEVINKPDNAVFLKEIEILQELRKTLLSNDEKKIHEIIDELKETFYTKLLENLDKINIPFQEQINYKQEQLATHYLSLSENENKPTSNTKIIQSINNEIKNLEDEINILNEKTKNTIDALEIAMKRYNPYLVPISLDKISLPKEYLTTHNQTTNILPIYHSNYLKNLNNATNESSKHEVLKDKIIKDNHDQKSLSNFISQSIHYTDTKMSISGVLSAAYFSAIKAYQNEYQLNIMELNDQFGNVFKEIFKVDLNIVLGDVKEQMKLIEQPPGKFFELFNKTFNDLETKKIEVFDYFGYNKKLDYAQKMLTAELNKVEDIIRPIGSLSAPDYKTLVKIEHNKIGNANLYIANMKQTQNELKLAHQNVISTLSLAEDAKNSLMDAVDREQKILTKKNTNQAQPQKASWKDEDEIYTHLTSKLQTLNFDEHLDEVIKQDELLLRFQTLLNNVRKKIGSNPLFHNKEFLEKFDSLNRLLEKVRSGNQAKSQRIPLDTLYVEIANNQKFRDVLENEMVKNKINKFIEITANFTQIPLVKVKHAKKVKIKKENKGKLDNIVAEFEKADIRHQEAIAQADADMQSETLFKMNPLHQPAKNLSQENPLYQDSNNQLNVKPNSIAGSNNLEKNAEKPDKELLEKIINALKSKKERNFTSKAFLLEFRFEKLDAIQNLCDSLTRSMINGHTYEHAMKEIFSDAKLRKHYNKIMKNNNIVSFFKSQDTLIKIQIDNIVHNSGKTSLNDLQNEIPKPSVPKKSFFGGKT